MAVGDAELKSADGQRIYRVNYGVNAMCRLEALVSPRSYQSVLAELNSGRPKMTTIRAYFQACLIEPKLDTAEAVGDALEDVGGAPVFLAAFAKADAAITEIGHQIEAIIAAGKNLTDELQGTTEPVEG